MTAAFPATSPAIETWFDEMIATLRVHQLTLQTNTAQEEVRSFYDTVINGSKTQLAFLSKEIAHQNFIPQIIIDYLSLVGNNMPLKLAFDISGSEILVWAEIEDDNYAMEHKLIMSEAKVNAKYHEFGYDLTSMIVEQGESLNIPNHYRIYKA